MLRIMIDSHKHRRSIRLPEYDYGQAGAYFVTICTFNRACMFGKVVGGKLRLSTYGQIAVDCWNNIPTHFKHTVLDAFVVMPNHVHGIVILAHDMRAQHAAPLPERSAPTNRNGRINVAAGSLGAVVRSYKAAVTKQINQQRGTPGDPIWQRNYYEHIIRNDEQWDRAVRYIINNPAKWIEDNENPGRRR